MVPSIIFDKGLPASVHPFKQINPRKVLFMDNPRNLMLSNVEINWAKLDKPVNPFGQEQYELQIATTEAAVADQWKADHLSVKEKDGKFTVSLKRKAHKASGDSNGMVRVVDANKAAIDTSVVRIGNGSVGNVIVWQAPYDVAGRSGIASSLTAVQITDLVEFNGGGVDFDIVAGGTDEPAPSADLF